ncbi:Hypothetical predicted protein [Pelobates cultripes]|uniref:Uncharacterized protein n=1 Tax=Pelobates cultripes TaxID=61616 RepID=A0AAD1SG83_PELCU|nr:Hypothetical predicted protein [Pelobates cultripes]
MTHGTHNQKSERGTIGDVLHPQLPTHGRQMPLSVADGWTDGYPRCRSGLIRTFPPPSAGGRRGIPEFPPGLTTTLTHPHPPFFPIPVSLSPPLLPPLSPPPALVTATKQTIQDYFLANETEDTTPLLCWEAHKVVLQGHFIAHCSARKKAHNQTITDLNKDIAELEYRHKQTLDPSTYRDLLLKRTQLTGHLNRAIQRSFQQFQHMVYEHGNKCGRLLATLLKKPRNHLYIPKIQNAAGRMCHLPDQISAAFTQYYEDLYNLR